MKLKYGESKSGFIHAANEDGIALCNPSTKLTATPQTEETCYNCTKQIKIMSDQEELRKIADQLPRMVRGGDGKIRLQRVRDNGKIDEKMTPFVTDAAANQWLDMAKKYKVDFANIDTIP